MEKVAFNWEGARPEAISKFSISKTSEVPTPKLPTTHACSPTDHRQRNRQPQIHPGDISQSLHNLPLEEISIGILLIPVCLSSKSVSRLSVSENLSHEIISWLCGRVLFLKLMERSVAEGIQSSHHSQASEGHE